MGESDLGDIEYNVMSFDVRWYISPSKLLNIYLDKRRDFNSNMSNSSENMNKINYSLLQDAVTTCLWYSAIRTFERYLRNRVNLQLRMFMRLEILNRLMSIPDF